MALGFLVLEFPDERCYMTKRIIVSLAAMGLLLPLAASAQKLRPVQQLAVYDADGKKVGVVTGAESAFGEFVPLAPFKVDDVPFMLLVFREGISGKKNVVWETADCSGTPSLTFFSPQRGSLPLVGVGLPGSTVYVEDGPARTITVRSFSTPPVPLDGRFPQPSQCYSQGFTPWSEASVPARPLIDMNTLFKPPFTVR